ncbi:hypothetical protein F5887DRAFT_1160952 [Amanita rubescens]|nr:hypothetical protein F5887DRAFT_1160952 [Amanita rubescens]
MRLVTFTLAFFFFSAVSVTPIKVSHHNNAGITKRSRQAKRSIGTVVQGQSSKSFGSSLSNSMDAAGGTTQVIRKRASEEQLISALKSIESTKIIRHETSGNVYSLEDEIDGWAAAVKIIDMKAAGVTNLKLQSERRNLYNVEQLLGTAHTKDERYYYLIMPHRGVPYSKISGLSGGKTKHPVSEAIARYVHHYCLQNLRTNIDKCVFWHDGFSWVIELVNWESARVVNNQECPKDRIKTPPKPFVILDHLGIFRPEPPASH